MENFDFGRLQEWLLQIVFIFVIIQFLVFGRASCIIPVIL